MVLLGIGSNLSSVFGDRFNNIEIAILLLKKHRIKIVKKSSFYETPAHPNKEDPKFINIIIQIKTDLKPLNLAALLIYIEKFLKRERGKKNSPRTCDIDIIDFKNKAFSFRYKNHKFSVPHKQLIFRNFVLYPLREIIPKWRHPKNNCLIDTFIEKLNLIDKKSILKVKKY
ncbi:MAG: 2-amino-4-hydroxy-6-hydroxymethyldihydropteridine diphosphokinase [Pelagibacterales bacterium]|nr:2-amino-4-hydroxy-6-hydroxymethyldihydropteridine diphosphokinase [Pelagibacterales bacterium]